MDSSDSNRLILEIIVRIILLFIYSSLGKVDPFEREILPEEVWLYQYPMTRSYVPQHILWPLLFAIPIVTILIVYKFKDDISDLQESMLALTLSMGLTAVTTDIIKLLTGKPRPDFFWRCFPDGSRTHDMQCSGKEMLINEGRKSFPSGHSSMSFATLGFLTLYLMAKLQIFNENGRGQSWRIIVCLLPLLLATMIALSRSCDYHHHPYDILAGTIIGLLYSYFCYHQYYPSVEISDVPYRLIK